MKETIFKLVLLMSLIGVLLIFFFQEELIFNFKNKQIIEFKVLNVKQYDKVTIIEAIPTSKIEIIYFDNDSVQIGCIRAYGEFEGYKLIAEDISKC